MIGRAFESVASVESKVDGLVEGELPSLGARVGKGCFRELRANLRRRFVGELIYVEAASADLVGHGGKARQEARGGDRVAGGRQCGR